MLQAWLFLIVGAIFGAGLVVSEMINPDKVQGFLDVFGQWDASLVFVMMGAVITTLIGYRLVLRRATPVVSSKFMLPSKKSIDGRLILGSAIFGIGWGLSGFCPGPAITGLATGVLDPLVLCLGLILGSVLCRFVD